MKRTWAIGDVHGCLIAMDTLLQALALEPDDELIFLGDLIDRGSDSKGVIDRILQLRQQRTVHVIQGNHEEMVLIARDLPGYARAWLQFGGVETLASYGWNRGIEQGWIEAIPQAHWSFLKNDLIDAFEQDGHLLVHGSVDESLAIAEQPWNELRWKKWDEPKPHNSGNIIVCGHTPQMDGKPLSIGHAICIDTWVYQDGWLTALELGSHEYVQSNNFGEVRRDRLP